MAKLNPFDYPIVFSIPEYIVPTNWTINIPFVMFLVDVTHPKILVDLGTSSAVPYSTFCQAVKELHLGTQCFGVDQWEENEFEGDHSKQKLPPKLVRHLKERYEKFATLISGSFEEAAQHFQDGSVDLLHITVNNKWNAIQRYYEIWMPKMSEQGVILFHDMNLQHDSAWTKFWEKVKTQYPSFELQHGQGLNMLAVGSHPPERLKQVLLNSDDMSKIQIGEFFLQRGNALVPLFEAAEKEAELELVRAKAHQFEQSNHILRYEKVMLERSLQQLQSVVAPSEQGTIQRIINMVLPPGSTQRKFAGKIKSSIRGLFRENLVQPPVGSTQVTHLQDPSNEISISAPQLTPAPANIVNGQAHVDVYFDLLSRTKGSSEEYIPLAENDIDPSSAQLKLIAFYLPQFHPIPLNDQWWGKGFTEWTNVSKAVPNFVGHYQPRLPGELNFYDLRLPEIQKRQVELAKKYGIHGFCFYYYWFNGKRLLELPLNRFIENSELDFPFCICWGNENWTRRWDGAEDNVLIGQTHSEEEYAAFIRDVAPILLEKRYIRIDGKPLVAVYRVNLLPNPKKAVEIWRDECRTLGVGEIYLAAVQSFDIEDPRSYDFDCAIEFPPHNCLNIAAAVDPLSLRLTNLNFAGNFFDYGAAAELMINKPVPDYVKFKTVMPSWDNTARRQNDSVIFINSSPSVYKNWLKKTIQYTNSTFPPGMRYIFINAWNEWAEGTYLEPDRLYGYAYLQATRDALEDTFASK